MQWARDRICAVLPTIWIFMRWDGIVESNATNLEQKQGLVTDQWNESLIVLGYWLLYAAEMNCLAYV
jgi:hypothetical protein